MPGGRDRIHLLPDTGLFLRLGGLSAGLLIVDSPRLRTAALLAICVWAFARAYYFAFYVLERYVDPSHRFSGVWLLLRFLLRGR